jgi:cysteine desulfurase
VLLTVFEREFPKKKTIVASPIEHPSVISTLHYLASRGANIAWLRVDKTGLVDPAHYQSLLSGDVMLVCCMLANNETGSIQDVRTMAESAHAAGTLFFSDCVQALGKIPVDLRALNVDYATFSAHKIHGPKGVGALYVKKSAPIAPFIHGGHQENGLRAGTENIHSIVGFARAMDDVPSLVAASSRIARLRQTLIDRLLLLKPDCTINTPLVSSIPNTVSVTFPGIENAVLIAVFNYYGIAVSAGSACSTPENKASHVLTAIGLSEAQARQTIRFSLGHQTTRRHITCTLDIIKKFLTHKTPSVDMIAPSFLARELLFDPGTYILDVRFWYDRLSIKSLPGAHEASFFSFARYRRLIPKNKNVIVICQGGFYSPMIAWYLKKRGWKRVGFLISGMEGWKAAQPDLYARHAGTNITVLKPRGVS